MATRDYARPQRPRPAAPRARPAARKSAAKPPAVAALGLPLWAWMVVSLSLMLFAAALYYISRPVAPMELAGADAGTRSKPAKVIEIPPKEPSRFAFYEMLPSYEVVVPEEVLNPSKPKPAANAPPPKSTTLAVAAEAEPATTAADVKPAAPKPVAEPARASTPLPPQPTRQLAGGEQFVIQVAAFRTRADAEQRVAALTLAGLAARVEQVTIDNSQTWFRVRLGPYGSAAAASTAQQSLKAQGFSGVVMKVRS